ncbi:septum site-determining protein Ssd [Corynebacterium sp. p3-SID1194]|uniref:septum site-determining protein Ssd n=1 Tax=Corynebacterium sp. p3-SID1194 TaxID=2916105 RepID=UPI0021A35C30|nr:septum site-determining protein Ssd [Corynebacterium sp. p3-SID1194]MCT1450598.1 hypothetical protein [Corynebacterium sp. p3-SID1194]
MTSETAPILIAVDDALLHPEATHLAAATGRPIIDSRGPDDLVRHYSRAFAVLIDVARAPDLDALPPRSGVFLLRGDTDADAGADSDAFILPAQAADLLKALGRLALAARNEKHGAAAPQSRSSAGTVLSFVGAAGGVGTSTFAAAVARAASQDADPVVVDAHRYSGGLDLLLGVEEEIGARWGEIEIGEGSVDRAQLRQALPRTRDGIAVLTCARTTVPAAAAKSLRTEVDRVTTVLGAGGLTVVDAPPDALPNRCDHTFVVVPGEVRAAAAAALISAECRAANTPVSLVLRHRGWSGLSAQEVERVAGADVVAEVKHLPRLVRTCEVDGLPVRLPSPLAAAAEKVLEAANG